MSQSCSGAVLLPAHLTPKFSPADTVESLGWWYVLEHQPSPTIKSKCSRQSAVRVSSRQLRRYLKREPIIADLTKETLLPFLASIKGQSGYKRTLDALRMLRRVAMELGILERLPGAIIAETDGRGGARAVGKRAGKYGRAPVSQEPGSLWHLCLTRFFPTNVRIRTDITRLNYRYAVQALKEFLQREPTPADLTEENVSGMMVMLRDSRGLEARTVNGYRGRICTLWTWCAKKRIVDQFPTVATFKAPKRIPRAWTKEQLDALFAACNRQRGFIAGLPRALWWRSLHRVLWDTSERIGALMDLEWCHVDFDRGILDVPAEIRKGDDARVYTLHAQTLADLKEMSLLAGSNQKVWPWPYCEESLWSRYAELREDAGLPPEKRISGFHRMRRSVASHLTAAGADATSALGHSSAALTRKSYIDPSIAGQVTPAQLLFRPEAGRSAERPSRPVAPETLLGVQEDAALDIEALAWL